MTTVLRVVLHLTAAAVMAGAPAASATDIPFQYRVGRVPDFDQQREVGMGHFGLPAGGLYYCGPTATMNWLAYIANHGYPGLAPGGPRDWQHDDNYNTISINIATLGLNFMDTQEDAGTSGGDVVRGTAEWFNAWGLGDLFTVSGQFIRNGYSPSAMDIADAALQGGLVTVVVGWYANPMPGVYTRDGGHLVSIVSMVGSGEDQFEIGIRDPGAEDGNPFAQGAFSTSSYTLEPVLGVFDGTIRQLYRVTDYANGDRAGFIDGFVTINPRYALTVTVADTLDLIPLGGLEHTAQRPSQSFPLVAAFSEAALHPALNSLVYFAAPGGVTAMYRLDLTTGVSSSILIPTDPCHLIVSRERVAYYIDGCGGEPSLVGLSLDPDAGAPISIPADAPVRGVAYDDVLDRVLVVADDPPHITAFAPDFATRQDFALPDANMQAGAFAATSPADGRLWLVTLADTTLVGTLWNEQTQTFDVWDTVFDPDLADAAGITIDDRNRIFVSTHSGAVLQYGELEFFGWSRVPSVLDGIPVGPFLAVSAGRDNFDIETMTTEAFRHELPTEIHPGVPDRPGDVNGDGAVDFLDILAVIGGWGPCNGCPADLDFTGAAGFSDLLIVLANWGG